MNLSTTPHTPAVHILIVDDERSTRLALTEAFTQSGYQTESAAHGQEALRHLRSQPYDAVILDLHLPGELTGLDILAVAPQVAPDTAFIVLTGHATTESAIAALRSGAYDYLQKPVSLQKIFETTRQVLAKRAERLREKDAVKLLRQALTTLADSDAGGANKPVENTPRLTVGDIALDEQRQQVTLAGTELTLTPIEYKLLHYFMHRPNVVLAYAELAEVSHEMPDLDEAEARALLRTHVYRLSRKLGNKKSSPLQTVRGRGVVLKDER